LTEYLKSPGWFHKIKAIYKLINSLVVSALISLALASIPMEGMTRIMVAWDIFSFCMILWSFALFATMCSKQIRVLAQFEDSSRFVVFVIVIIASLGSLAGILLLLGNKGSWLLPKGLETFIYIAGVTFSWLLLHTMFTFRYAHYYYGDRIGPQSTKVGGLEIPDEKCPDYLDFAYFSFVIGMTFQVSDITISSRHIRRLALLHGLLSFVFNTVIVALTINLVVELRG
jgi:uncharacterized membrane protein